MCFKFKKYLPSQSGTSLIEMMVAIGLFIILGTVSLNILKSTVDSQRNAIASQNIQESLRYAFEIMSKEMRSAVVSKTDCNASSGNEIYYNSGTPGSGQLNFKNKDNECVEYYINNQQLMIKRAATALAVTPDDIKITSLDFIVTDNTPSTPPGSKIQPRVTMKIQAQGTSASGAIQQTVLQTTVSSRNYE